MMMTPATTRGCVHAGILCAFALSAGFALDLEHQALAAR